MKTVYLDCFAGISGDMLLGALFDLGIAPQELAGQLALLGLGDFSLRAEKAMKKGLGGTRALVEITGRDVPHRHLRHILEMIDDSALPPAVKHTSGTVFHALAAAEGKIHNIDPQEVHFHEVGAVDSIIDIVGSVLALHLLGIGQVVCSPLPLGTGFVKCAHGTIPLPAPAALELLRGVPTRGTDIEGETVTPTGAALVKTLALGFGPLPAMTVDRVGYGAGSADRHIPNLLRLVVGEASALGSLAGAGADWDVDYVDLIETNVDDMNPEFYEYIFNRLFAAGCLDVFLTPVIMKKGRPGQVLSCVCPEQSSPAAVDILLRETTSLGVRTYPSRRYKLARQQVRVQLEFGPVSVKLGLHPQTGQVLNAAPEWADCQALAAESGIPVKTVYDLAKAEAYKLVERK